MILPVSTQILAFAGSLRKDSWNKKLIRVAVEKLQASGAQVTLIDLRDFQLPVFDEDLERESGLPENAKKLKALFLAHGGLLISSPEYNSSIPGVLKNAIDWLSRPAPGEKPLECFNGKIAGLLSASPGALGGLRGLVHLRAVLGNLNVTVLPNQFALGKAHEAFQENESLKDSKSLSMVESVIEPLKETLLKLTRPI